MFQYLSKKRNQKGFTLIEMLIVVAIIAILVAIAVPTFSSQLENSKKAVDQSNLRAAESLAVADYMLNHQNVDTAYYTVNSNNGNLEVVYATSGTAGSLLPKWKDLNGKGGLYLTITSGKVTANSWGVTNIETMATT